MNDFEAWQKILEEWKKLERVKKINQRLYDQLYGSIIYILQYSKKNNINLPNKDRLWELMDKSHFIMDEMDYALGKIPTENQQRNKTTDDSTEPK